MKPRDLFGLGVRLFGLWFIYRALPFFSIFISSKLYPTSDKDQSSAASMLIYPILDLTLAAFFLLKADLVVRWSYDEIVPEKDAAPVD